MNKAFRNLFISWLWDIPLALVIFEKFNFDSNLTMFFSFVIGFLGVLITNKLLENY